MNIIAIDPGTRHTGVVYMNERGILCVKTIQSTEATKQDQYALKARAEQISRQLTHWIADKPHELIVIEGFTAFAGRASSNTFQTPYLCGYLMKLLEDENIVIQTSNQVLAKNGWGDRLREQLKTDRAAIPGAKCITNDHLRSAAVHGWFYLMGK